EVAAGGLALACAHHVNVGAVRVHHVLLVALATIPAGLENEPGSVAAEIRFGILAAIRKLPDGTEKALLGVGLYGARDVTGCSGGGIRRGIGVPAAGKNRNGECGRSKVAEGHENSARRDRGRLRSKGVVDAHGGAYGGMALGWAECIGAGLVRARDRRY